MDFTFSPEALMMQDTLRKFITEELIPVQEKNRLDREVPPPADLRKKLRKRSVELGFYGIDMPEEVGGRNISTVDRMLLHEAAKRHVFDRNLRRRGRPTRSCSPAPDKQRRSISPALEGEIDLLRPGSPARDRTRRDISTTAVKKGDMDPERPEALHHRALRGRTSPWCSPKHRQGEGRAADHCFLVDGTRRGRLRSPSSDGRQRLGGRAGVRGLRGVR
jgi:hypothetical protein